MNENESTMLNNGLFYQIVIDLDSRTIKNYSEDGVRVKHLYISKTHCWIKICETTLISEAFVNRKTW